MEIKEIEDIGKLSYTLFALREKFLENTKLTKGTKKSSIGSSILTLVRSACFLAKEKTPCLRR